MLESLKKINFKNLLKEIFVIIAIIMMNGIKFYDVLKRKSTFVLPLDASDLIYPNYYYIAQSLKNYIFPLWDPHLFSGFSLAGYPQYGLFYPGNIIFWLFPYGDNPFPYYAYEYLVIFHIFLAGWFMYMLGREFKFDRIISLCMGTIYMFSPAFLKFIVWGNAITAFPWFPLVFLFSVRAFHKERLDNIHNTFFAGVFLGLIILAAPSQPTIMILMILGLLYLVEIYKYKNNYNYIKNASKNFFIIISTGILIGSVTLLPVLESTPLSIRFLGEDGSLVGNAKMSLRAFTHIIVPITNLFGFLFPQYSASEVGTNFFGIIPFTLALIAMIFLYKKNDKIKFLKLVFIIALLYSFGIILPYIFYFIPFLNKIREPQRYLMFISFVIPVLSGFTIDYLLSTQFVREFKDRISTKFDKVILLLIASCAIILLLCQYNFVKDISRQIIYLSLLCIIILQLLIAKPKRYVYIFSKIIVLFLIFIELLGIPFSNFDAKETHIKEYFDSYSQLEKLKPSGADEFRVTAVEASNWPYPHNAGDIVGFNDTLGYGNPILFNLMNYRNKVSYDSKYYDMLNVKYFLAYDESKARIEPLISKDLAKLNDSIQNVIQPTYNLNKRINLDVYENKNRLGEAWVVDKILYSEPNDIINKIENTNFDPNKEAVIASDNKSKINLEKIKSENGKLNYQIDFIKKESNCISLNVNTNKESLLVLSELYYPGWNVYVNGKKQNIFEVNQILKGTILTKGESRVEFKFEPMTVYMGLTFAMISIAIIVSVMIIDKFGKEGKWKSRCKKVLLISLSAIFIVMMLYVVFLL